MGTCDNVPISHKWYIPFTLGHYRFYFKHSQKVKMCDIAIREQMNGIERDRTGGEMR
jgi:hypothetical protein